MVGSGRPYLALGEKRKDRKERENIEATRSGRLDVYLKNASVQSVDAFFTLFSALQHDHNRIRRLSIAGSVDGDDLVFQLIGAGLVD